MAMARRNPREKFHKATLKFALAQLEAGEMSLHMVSESDDPERRQAYNKDARGRFDRAVRALQAISLRPDEERIGEKLNSLKSRLAGLGEEFPDEEVAWDHGAGTDETMDSQRQTRLSEMHEKFERTLFDFVSNEIELATTFASLTQNATHRAKRERSAENALKGYHTALDFMSNKLLTVESRKELTGRLRRLEQTLKDLGKPTERAQARGA